MVYLASAGARDAGKVGGSQEEEEEEHEEPEEETPEEAPSTGKKRSRAVDDDDSGDGKPPPKLVKKPAAATKARWYEAWLRCQQDNHHDGTRLCIVWSFSKADSKRCREVPGSGTMQREQECER